MNLPFTVEQFLNIFVSYNTSVWPAQILLNILGIAAIGFCFRKTPSRTVPLILAGLWIWTGVVYHILYFSVINPAAFLFGALCIIQGGIFLWFGFSPGMEFRFVPGWRAYTGALLILYGLVIYPVLGYFLGHRYPASPTFGVPCPTTIFTFGLLLWTTHRLKWFCYLLPLIWSVIGFTAAFTLGVREDIGLLVAGIVGTTLLATMRTSPGEGN